MRWRQVGAIVASFAVVGCTSLSVSGVEPEATGTQRPATLTPGFPYRLPAATLTPAAFLTIKDCPADADAKKALIGSPSPVGAEPVTEVKFAVSGTVAIEQVPDQLIVIDYRRLKTFLKTTSVGIERHPNGMLKSINATIEDESPAVIADLVAVAGSVALLATGAPGAGALAAASLAAGGVQPAGVDSHAKPPKRAPVTFLSCRKSTREAIAERAAAEKTLADTTALLQAVAEKLAQLGSGKDDAAEIAKLKAEVEKLTGQMDAASGKVASINEQLSLPLDRIVSADAPDGPPIAEPNAPVRPSAFTTGVILTTSPERLERFMSQHFVLGKGEVAGNKQESFLKRACAVDPETGNAMPDESCSSMDALRRLLRKVAKVTARERGMAPVADNFDGRPAAAALVSQAKPHKGIPAGQVNARDGIIFIEPAKLRIDLTVANIGPAAASRPFRTIKTVNASVPQRGRYLSLPLEADFGEKVSLDATFADDGSLLTGKYGNAKSAGKALSGALRGAAEAAVTTQTAVEDRRAKLLKTRAEMLASLVSAQESTQKLRPSADPLKDINAEIARLTAEAALAEAELRLRAANTALGRE